MPKTDPVPSFPRLVVQEVDRFLATGTLDTSALDTLRAMAIRADGAKDFEVRPGDTIVVQPPADLRLSMDARERLKAELETLFPGTKTAVLEGGLTFQVVKPRIDLEEEARLYLAWEASAYGGGGLFGSTREVAWSAWLASKMDGAPCTSPKT